MANNNIKITIKDNTKDFMEQVVQKMPLILDGVGKVAEGYAKEDCPVDTGLLRNSLTYAISGERPVISSYSADKEDEKGVIQTGSYDGAMPAEEMPQCYSVCVGSNVKYAPAQEYNESYHHKVGKAHFIRDALQDHKSEYKDNIEAILLTISYTQKS